MYIFIHTCYSNTSIVYALNPNQIVCLNLHPILIGSVFSTINPL